MNERILVVVPCYNCADQIERSIKGIKEKLLKDANNVIENVLVLDNCSQDDTFQVAQQCIETIGDQRILLAQNNLNYGLGGSFKLAIAYAKENKYDYMALIHGDAQSDPVDLIGMIDLLRSQESSVAVLGARFMPGAKLFGYSKLREYVNRLLNILFSVLTLRKISEIGSGLNLYRLSGMDNSAVEHFPDHIAFDVNLLLYYVDKKHRIDFYPISWFEEDQKSTVSNIDVGIKIVTLLLKWRLGISISIDRSIAKRTFKMVQWGK